MAWRRDGTRQRGERDSEMRDEGGCKLMDSGSSSGQQQQAPVTQPNINTPSAGADRTGWCGDTPGSRSARTDTLSRHGREADPSVVAALTHFAFAFAGQLTTPRAVGSPTPSSSVGSVGALVATAHAMPSPMHQTLVVAGPYHHVNQTLIEGMAGKEMFHKHRQTMIRKWSGVWS